MPAKRAFDPRSFALCKGMDDTQPIEMFLIAPPGLEDIVASEARQLGLLSIQQSIGGVTASARIRDIMRANLMSRCATRILIRIASFRAMHLAQLDKRARRVAWGAFLRDDVPIRVEATTRGSRIYHAGAATQRIERAIHEELGAPVSKDASLVVKARIDDDLCTLSLDTSGDPLHRRGHKLAVGKAPLRETLAAAFLRSVGFTGSEPVVDPMCGSGTFILEAAEIAAGLAPGRSRGFVFQETALFDPVAWDELSNTRRPCPTALPAFVGSDRDAGAIRISQENASRAGLSDHVQFVQRDVSQAEPPPGPAGLVMINPPYGARIGNKRLLYAVYARMGEVLRTRFKGWRVGLVTGDGGLARATGLPFKPPGPHIPHGGLKVRLYATEAL